MERRLWAAALLLCAETGLGGCGDISRFQFSTAAMPPAPAPKPKGTVTSTPASEREHERILSSYGGAYDDPRLESLVSKTVDRLGGASHPAHHAHKSTLPQSPARNTLSR